MVIHHWLKVTISNWLTWEIESTRKSHNWYTCKQRLWTCRINLSQSTWEMKNIKRNLLNSRCITLNSRHNLLPNLIYKLPSHNLHYNCKKILILCKWKDPKILSTKHSWPNMIKSPLSSICSKTNIMHFRKDKRIKSGLYNIKLLNLRKPST